MSVGGDRHLDEDLIVRAIVDEESLSPEAREHLAGCGRCAEEKTRTEATLLNLGRTAKRIAPASRLKASDIVEKVTRRRSSWGWLGTHKVGIAAAAMLVVISGFALDALQENRLSAVNREIVEDARFMNEIDRLEDETLPTVFLEITDGPDADIDEDAPEHLVPPPSAQHLSGLEKSKIC